MISLREDGEQAPVDLSMLTGLTEAIFEPGGYLESALGLEHRPQQEAMARAMAESLAERGSLLFEAGTGVGKSLAYLIPGIIWAVETEQPLVVSTHTIALQEQLKHKDLPLARQLFERVPDLGDYAEYKVAVLVGKGNYLCTTRLERLMREAGDLLLPSDEQLELRRIAEWAAHSATGLRQELDPAPAPEVWDMVNADASTCSRRNCDCQRCFYQRARAEAMAAQVRVLNHSLLFSLIQAGAVPPGNQPGVLFYGDAVVLDEAHTVPGIATDHFGLNLSHYAVDFALKRLHNARKKSGFLKKYGWPGDCQLVEAALEASAEFFGWLDNAVLGGREVVRIREAGFAEPVLVGPLQALIERLGSVEQRTQSEDVIEELRDHRRRIVALLSGVKDFLTLASEDHVHWIERVGRRRSTVCLRTAPLDVAPYLREALFQRNTCAALTSATLAIGGELDSFRERVGAEAAQGVVEASPFDFPKQMRVFIGVDAPEPNPREQRRLDHAYLTEMIAWCAQRLPGGSLVLFTSYGDLNAVAEGLEVALADSGRPLFVQGRAQSRRELTERFAKAGNGLLLGTESFWTGVDVPGAALSQVILTRLPFENPSHPIAEARAEALRAKGGNPFMELTLPDALLKFRQGIGRLIRKADDRGVVVVLDSRVLGKRYGQLFLKQLPVRTFRRLRKANRDIAYPQNPFGD